MVDDCFDMAKSLVAALFYGMSSRSSSQGRISMLPALLSKLIRGGEVGPATAIGQDYRVLEVNRVIKLRPDIAYPVAYSVVPGDTTCGKVALTRRAAPPRKTASGTRQDASSPRY